MTVDRLEGTEEMRVAEMNRLHTEICGMARKTLEKVIILGGKLQAEKQRLGSRKWTPWVNKNLDYKADRANEYIRLYIHRGTIPVGTTGIEKALKFTRRLVEPTNSQPRVKGRFVSVKSDSRPTEDIVADGIAEGVGSALQAHVELAQEEEVGITYEEAKKKVLSYWQSMTEGENEKAAKHLAYVFIDFLFKIYPDLQDQPFE